ncbi:MAG: hydrogenase maturation protease [Actinomycetota bacterium]
MNVVIIGVGNTFRRDDAAGLEVARLVGQAQIDGVTTHAHEGTPDELIELWEGAGLAIVVDAVRGTGVPGSTHRIEVGNERIPDRARRDSSHALGIGDAVELARALRRLPERLVIVGIEAEEVGAGIGMTPAVAAAVTELARGLVAECREAADV